jgi:hypothetical protein
MVKVPPPKSKFPPREHFVPKVFSNSFLPNSSGYGVITTTNLVIPAHKDGSKNTSNQVFFTTFKVSNYSNKHTYTC